MSIDELEIEQEEGGEEISEKLKKVRGQLKQCQQEKHDYLAGWQRAQADFINYKRRQEEQMSDWLKMFGEGLIYDLLPVLDSLESRNHTEHDTEPRGKEIASGIKMIKEQLLAVLKKHGLEEIKSIGEKFNPKYHEAVEREASEAGEEIIIEEMQKGYLLNGKVIRAAKVKVSK